MARGWESKSIEIQIEEAGGGLDAGSWNGQRASKSEASRQLEGLLLQRSNALQEVQKARNPRYKSMLEEKLAYLNQKICQFR